jgi:Phage tail assembly chaperone protein, TAC
MKIAFHALEWPPDVFWCATPQEFYLAIEAINDASGPGPAMARDRMEELLESYG